MSKKRNLILFIGLTLLLLCIGFFSMMFGGSAVSKKDVMKALFFLGSGNTIETIVWQVRFPRVMLGLLVGAGLASCGCVFQGMLRNPLAGPYTLGLSGGAALGATLAMVLRLGGLWPTVSSFLGALLSISLIYTIASRRRFSVTTLILCGVIMNFLLSSLVLLVFAISRTEDIHGAIIWLMGDLSSSIPSLVTFVSIPVLPGIVFITLCGRDLNILTLGEERALHLGLETEFLKKVLFTVASVVTGACVACSGIIGFVGLIIPHIMRQITGPDHRVLIPASAIGGAVFLILSDTLARTIISPLELPVGVITGIAGGFFFLTFLLRQRRWQFI